MACVRTYMASRGQEVGGGAVLGLQGPGSPPGSARRDPTVLRGRPEGGGHGRAGPAHRRIRGYDHAHHWLRHQHDSSLSTASRRRNDSASKFPASPSSFLQAFPAFRLKLLGPAARVRIPETRGEGSSWVQASRPRRRLPAGARHPRSRAPLDARASRRPAPNLVVAKEVGSVSRLTNPSSLRVFRSVPLVAHFRSLELRWS
jgi:hypothetical protein